MIAVYLTYSPDSSTTWVHINSHTKVLLVYSIIARNTKVDIDISLVTSPLAGVIESYVSMLISGQLYVKDNNCLRKMRRSQMFYISLVNYYME